MRHFLFILPPLAVLMGLSVAGLLRAGICRFVKQGGIALIIMSLALTIFDMVQLDAYQSVYFNRMIAGGLAAAATRFETDYWGNS